MNDMAVGVDIAKNVFQVHYVDRETGEIVNKPIKRAKFLEHFANRAPCLIGMEACGGAHHWARQLTKMGHEVKLMPARFVKAFNIGNKSDAADARAIWLAVQQPGKAVAVKTEMQHAMLGPHRMGEQLVKFRTMQSNGLVTDGDGGSGDERRSKSIQIGPGVCRLGGSGGTDLTQIHGIGLFLALRLIGECGADLSRWPTAKHFTSWLTLSPGCKISGGKVLSSHTRKTTNHVTVALRYPVMRPRRCATPLP
jgi:transposase